MFMLDWQIIALHWGYGHQLFNHQEGIYKTGRSHHQYIFYSPLFFIASSGVYRPAYTNQPVILACISRPVSRYILACMLH